MPNNECRGNSIVLFCEFISVIGNYTFESVFFIFFSFIFTLFVDHFASAMAVEIHSFYMAKTITIMRLCIRFCKDMSIICVL